MTKKIADVPGEAAGASLQRQQPGDRVGRLIEPGVAGLAVALRGGGLGEFDDRADPVPVERRVGEGPAGEPRGEEGGGRVSRHVGIGAREMAQAAVRGHAEAGAPFGNIVFQTGEQGVADPARAMRLGIGRERAEHHLGGQRRAADVVAIEFRHQEIDPRLAEQRSRIAQRQALFERVTFDQQLVETLLLPVLQRRQAAEAEIGPHVPEEFGGETAELPGPDRQRADAAHVSAPHLSGSRRRGRSGRQTWPAQTVQSGMSRVTRERAPITAPVPIRTPGITIVSAAIQA